MNINQLPKEVQDRIITKANQLDPSAQATAAVERLTWTEAPYRVRLIFPGDNIVYGDNYLQLLAGIETEEEAKYIAAFVNSRKVKPAPTPQKKVTIYTKYGPESYIYNPFFDSWRFEGDPEKESSYVKEWNFERFLQIFEENGIRIEREGF